jgi:hypothetical protein
MKFFKNSDDSYDILNNHRILFHYAAGQNMKKIGHVNEAWRHQNKQLKSVPPEVFLKATMIENVSK